MGFLGNAFGFSSIICSVAKNAERLFKKKLNDTSYMPTLHRGLPPCFARLPTDLKLKILGFLPGVEIAKVSCLSSELRYLGSSDDLWKKKYVEQFGDGETSGGGGHWKEKFVKSWESRKRRKLICSARPFSWRFLGDRHPFPVPMMPHIIGGDHDLLPPQFDNTRSQFRRAPPARQRNLVLRHHQLGGDRNNITYEVFKL